MKSKIAIAVLLLLTLSSCGKAEVLVTGEVVSCQQISLIENPREVITPECLDSSQGVNVAAIKGPAIINVWGSWCEPCREEIPHFAEPPDDGRTFPRTHAIMWPNLYDSDGSTRKYFGMGVPVTWFIDATGKVVHKKIGPVKSAAEIRTLAFKYLGVS